MKSTNKLTEYSVKLECYYVLCSSINKDTQTHLVSNGCQKRITSNGILFLSFPQGLNETECDALLLPNGIREMLMVQIYTDEARFQNRKKLLLSRVYRIVNKWSLNNYDPITVFLENGKYYVLAGHHRFAAMKILKLDSCFVKVFIGSESEAIEFAKCMSNRLSEKETFIETVDIFRIMKYENNKTRKELEDLFVDVKSDINLIDSCCFLDSNGKFLTNYPNKAFPYLKMYMRWVGDFRKLYGDKFTNMHEIECFDYFYNRNKIFVNKLLFETLINGRLGSLTFDSSKPLDLSNEMLSEAESHVYNNALRIELNTVQSSIEHIQGHLKYLKDSYMQPKYFEFAHKESEFNVGGSFDIKNTTQLLCGLLNEEKRIKSLMNGNVKEVVSLF